MIVRKEKKMEMKSFVKRHVDSSNEIAKLGALDSHLSSILGTFTNLISLVSRCP